MQVQHVEPGVFLESLHQLLPCLSEWNAKLADQAASGQCRNAASADLQMRQHVMDNERLWCIRANALNRPPRLSSTARHARMHEHVVVRPMPDMPDDTLAM